MVKASYNQSLSCRLSLTLRHAGSQFLELGIEPVPLKWEQESTARKVYRTSTILVPISAFSGEAGNLCQTLPEGQPGHDISSDTCLLIPLRSVPTASPELQICRSSCGEGNGTLLQYSCLENPMDGGAWWAEIHGVAKSQTRLHFHFSLSCIGEGNGNPLQCSCLENPRDGVPGGLPSMGSHRSDMTEVTQQQQVQLLPCMVPWTPCVSLNMPGFLWHEPRTHFNILKTLIRCHVLLFEALTGE